MLIRPARASDESAIWSIIGPTIKLPRDMSEADALAYWMGADGETFVAEADGEVLGTYYMRPNQRAAAIMSATAAT